MKNKIFGKGLVLTIVVLFIGTGIVSALNVNQEKQGSINDEILDSNVSNGEDKPDLVIEDIFLWPSWEPFTYHFECSVKNIGDTNTTWYGLEVEVSVKVYWLLFGKIPILPVFSYSHTTYLDVILPGLPRNLSVASCDELPKFGTYRFYLTVNPHKTIDESDYDNNKYSEDWKVFFG